VTRVTSNSALYCKHKHRRFKILNKICDEQGNRETAGNTDNGSEKARNYHNNLNKPTSPKPNVRKFEGHEEKLKGYIYDSTD